MAATSGATSAHQSSPTSPVSGFKTLAPPSPPSAQGQRPTTAAAPEPVPTGLRPLSLTPSYSDMSIVSAYTSPSPSGLTSVLASPAGSMAHLQPAPEDDDFEASAAARDAQAVAAGRGGSALEHRSDGSF
jgi:hypothetical protein